MLLHQTILVLGTPIYQAQMSTIIALTYSEIIEEFLRVIDFTHFGVYMQDYGGPIGFRIITRHPEWLEW
jgi:hypothetical protein